jgi:serine/threonine-protein kinase
MTSLTSHLLLPADVLVIPVSELSPKVREQLAGESGDVAVTRPRGRHPSCIVDARSAALLERFRRPSTVAGAVVDYARAAGGDPSELLEDAYPVLRRLLDTGFLVAADSELAQTIRPSLEPGDRLGPATVVRCVHVLEDTELHQVRLADGRLAAAKLLRPGAPVSAGRHLAHEETVLRRLDGRVNPRPLAEPPSASGECLLMEWRDGAPVEVAAAEARAERPRDGGRALLALCRAVVAAFAHLHEQGVVHGDVHPRNVLIPTAGPATVVDYGLARAMDAVPPVDRGGVAFYFEPELAAPWRRGEPLPPPSPLGEQYGVGALLYLLVTGAHRLDFSPEREAMLREIEEEPPRAFEVVGAAPWPELERVLRRALAKQPSARFADLAALGAELDVLARRAAPTRAPTRTAGPASAAARRFVAEVSPGGELHRHPERLDAPRCSVNYGASGIALALCRIAMARDDPALLALADHWATLSLRDSGRDDAFVSEALDITPAVTGSVSPYHRESGVHCVRALVGAAMGNETLQLRATEAFLEAARGGGDGPDLTLGRSGVLIACALLRDVSAGAAVASLDALAQSTLDEIWDELDALPAIASTDDRYGGIAHGWAGYVYAALVWSAAAGAAPPPGVRRRIEELAGLAMPVGRGLAWPVRPGRPDTMSGWCHGSAGYVHLWLAAAGALGDDGLRELAVRAGWHAWEAPDTVGSLCCGLGGRAYAMLALHRAAGADEWLRRAEQLADAAVYGIERYDLPPHSLWKGFAGLAVLAEDLVDPAAAAMPLFEREPALA